MEFHLAFSYHVALFVTRVALMGLGHVLHFTELINYVLILSMPQIKAAKTGKEGAMIIFMSWLKGEFDF